MTRPNVERALYEAVSGLWLADSSDYTRALWDVVRALDPEVADRLETRGRDTYLEVEARYNHPTDFQKVSKILCDHPRWESLGHRKVVFYCRIADTRQVQLCSEEGVITLQFQDFTQGRWQAASTPEGYPVEYRTDRLPPVDSEELSRLYTHVSKEPTERRRRDVAAAGLSILMGTMEPDAVHRLKLLCEE